MTEPKQDRRTFIGTLARGVAASAITPGILAGTLSACSSPRALAAASDDDLKKIQAALKGSEPRKWVFTGDSITQGAKHTLGYRSYPEIFSERVRFEMGRYRDIVINTAVSGHTTREIRDDFTWRVGQFNPDIVFLMIGTNDAARVRHITVPEFSENLAALVKNIRLAGAIPVLLTPNTIDMGADAKHNERADLPLYVEQIRKVSAASATVLVDNWKFWEQHKSEVAGGHWRDDPLHPNGKGHLEIARLLFQTLAMCDDHSFTCVGEVSF